MSCKTFEMTHLFFENSTETFNKETAPSWLSTGGRKGSTMDTRWFFEGHVLTLDVGATIETDFHSIKRLS